MARASIIIEGSSTATGIYDESSKDGSGSGFVGHLQAYVNNYNVMTIEGIRPAVDPGAPSIMSTYTHASLDCHVPHYSHNISTHADEARLRARYVRSKVLGIFIIGSRPDYDVMKFGKEQTLERWRHGYEVLSNSCLESDVDAILIAAPTPPQSLLLNNGQPADRALLVECMRQAYITAENIEAPLIPFARMLDAPDLGPYMARDGKHANAMGYQRMFDFLLPIIEHKLGIHASDSAQKTIDSFTPIGRYEPHEKTMDYDELTSYRDNCDAIL
jgi:hypothetical protein